MTAPTALVTGASAGLGRALVLALAEKGWSLVIDARRPGPLAEITAELEARGATVRSLPGDVVDADHRADLVAEAEALGGVDLLVLNAGTLGPRPLPRIAVLDPAELEDTLRTNVVAPVDLVRVALPSLRRRRGTVVAVTSDAAVEGYETWAAYGASKAALEQAAHVLAAEEPDVRVHRFDPGDMRTRMHADAFPDEDISDRPEPETVVPALLRLVVERPPSGRHRASDLVDGTGAAAAPGEVA